MNKINIILYKKNQVLYFFQLEVNKDFNKINIIYSFEVQYFTCGGSHATLTIDTRVRENSSGTETVKTRDTVDIAATPLEKLIHSKYVFIHHYLQPK